jgi:hypothetical protein
MGGEVTAGVALAGVELTRTPLRRRPQRFVGFAQKHGVQLEIIFFPNYEKLVNCASAFARPPSTFF